MGTYFPLFDVYALDQKPQGKRQFADNPNRKYNRGHCRKGPTARVENSKTIHQIAKTRSHQQDAQNPWKVARVEDQVPNCNPMEGKEYLPYIDPTFVQIEKQ